jgi:hypothetical protein
MSEITITAYRGLEDEPWRLDRVRDVRDRLSPEVQANIKGLHDHKGCLGVNWRDMPSDREIEAVAGAWSKENEMLMNHYVDGAAILEDVDFPDGWDSRPIYGGTGRDH